jgi:RAQPRD family integrative conjugative element protein
MADAAGERAELVRLLHELESLDLVVSSAETAAVSTQRIRFQYVWLRGDIEKMKAGIREYLDSAPVTPRVPPPLAGDYIR